MKETRLARDVLKYSQKYSSRVLFILLEGLFYITEAIHQEPKSPEVFLGHDVRIGSCFFCLHLQPSF